jgi:hypothetical protein
MNKVNLTKSVGYIRELFLKFIGGTRMVHVDVCWYGSKDFVLTLLNNTRGIFVKFTEEVNIGGAREKSSGGHHQSSYKFFWLTPLNDTKGIFINFTEEVNTGGVCEKSSCGHCCNSYKVLWLNQR